MSRVQHCADGALGTTHETGRVRSTNTGTTVTNVLVRDRELGEVVASHLGLDLNSVCETERVSSATAAIARPENHVLKTFPL